MDNEEVGMWEKEVIILITGPVRTKTHNGNSSKVVAGPADFMRLSSLQERRRREQRFQQVSHLQ
jgi:hypothetical protein